MPDNESQKIDEAKARIDKLVSAGQWQEAETACRDLTDALTAAGNRFELQLAMVLHQLGFILEAQGRHAEAAKMREQTSDLLLERADENKPRTDKQ